MTRSRLLVMLTAALLSAALSSVSVGEEIAPPAFPWELLLDQANESFGQYREQEAIALCQQVLASDAPVEGKAEAHLIMAEIYAALGDYDAAIAEAQVALGMECLSEENRAELLAKIEALRQEQAQFEEKIASLRAILAASPPPEEAAPAQFDLGYTYLIYGQRERAREELEKVIAFYPASEYASRAAGRIAILYDLAGNEEQAEEYYFRAYELAKEVPYHRAVAEYRERLSVGAALRGRPRLPPEEAARLRYELANLHLVYGREGQAEEEYQALIRDCPNTPEAPQAAKRLAWRYEVAGREAEAQQVHEQAVSLYIQQGAPMKAAAAMKSRYLRKGGPDAAIAALKELVSTYPDAEVEAAAHLGLGEIYEREGDNTSAVKCYQAALVLSSNVRGEERQLSEVGQQAQRALSDLRFRLGSAAHARGEHAEALQQLTPVFEDDLWAEDKLAVADMLVASHMALGSYREAIEIALRAIQDDPYRREHLPFLFRVGMCQYYLGAYREAIGTFYDVAGHDEVGTLTGECRRAVRECADALRKEAAVR